MVVDPEVQARRAEELFEAHRSGVKSGSVSPAPQPVSMGWLERWAWALLVPPTLAVLIAVIWTAISIYVALRDELMAGMGPVMDVAVGLLVVGLICGAIARRVAS